MFYGYIRISTKHQTFDAQEYELKKYAREKDFMYDRVFREQISGAEPFRKREIHKLMKELLPGDTVVTTEISRIARRVFPVVEFFHFCIHHKVNLITLHEGYELSSDPRSQFMYIMYAFTAELERHHVSQRIREGQEARRMSGKNIGRQPGCPPRALKLDDQHNTIASLIELGVSCSQIAQIMRVDRATVRLYVSKRFSREWQEKNKWPRQKKRRR